MNTYKKFYFISMQVISLVCSLVFAVAEIYILFAYLFPCLTLIKEYPDVMMDMSVFILLLALFVIAFGIIIGFSSINEKVSLLYSEYFVRGIL